VVNGGALDEEVADSGEWVATAQVAGVAVGLLEPVGQVLAKAGQLRFGADQQFGAAVPAGDDDIDLPCTGLGVPDGQQLLDKLRSG